MVDTYVTETKEAKAKKKAAEKAARKAERKREREEYKQAQQSQVSGAASSSQ